MGFFTFCLVQNRIKSSLEKDDITFQTTIFSTWETRLRQEAAFLPSLKNTDANFYSLKTTHPVLWTVGSNPHEVTKAIVQCKMLSGRYRTAMLTRHWSSDKSGCCFFPTCPQVAETLDHILLSCPAYDQVRSTLIRLWHNVNNAAVHKLVNSVLGGPSDVLLKFILVASTNLVE